LLVLIGAINVVQKISWTTRAFGSIRGENIQNKTVKTKVASNAMKFACFSSVLCLTTFCLITFSSKPSQAQFVSIPVTNGSFALSNLGTGNQYSAPLVLLSPAGAIDVKGAVLPIYQSVLSITTNTPIGVYISQINGSVSLTDGRTAGFANGAAKLETLASVTGTGAWTTGSLLPVGATASFQVINGSFDIPQAALSAYPTPQVAIPITGGSFTFNAPERAAPDRITLNSLLTPVGTANLTLTNPVLTSSANPFPYVIGPEPQTVTIGGMANGKVMLEDGRVATVRDRFVSFQGTAQVNSAPPQYQFPAVYPTPVTLRGDFTGGVISVSATDVAFPPAPPMTVQVPMQVPTVIAAEPIAAEPSFEFAANTVLGTDPNDFPKFEHQRKLTPLEDIPEVDQSPLAISRINPWLRAQ
jgi:hypothetical protein